MGRPRVILQSEFPYNITARCINREWFQIPMDDVWNIFCEELKRTCLDHGLAVHSFVLMSNHFHLIASTPNANISQCLHQFMTRTSWRLATAGNRINETFAGRNFKCILHRHNSYLNAYKYNYRNPVTAGICSRVEDYPYSTLQAVIKRQKVGFPLMEDVTYHTDPGGTLKWLNTCPDPSKIEAVRFGLRHQYFRSKKSRGHQYIIKENEIL